MWHGPDLLSFASESKTAVAHFDEGKTFLNILTLAILYNYFVVFNSHACCMCIIICRQVQGHLGGRILILFYRLICIFGPCKYTGYYQIPSLDTKSVCVLNSSHSCSTSTGCRFLVVEILVFDGRSRTVK